MKVVPDWSAKLGIGPPLETIIPVDTDHRQIAQFPDRDDKQYSVVRSNLVYLTSSHKGDPQSNGKFSSEDMRWKDILLWLDAFRSPLGSTINKERARGTCKWIFEKQPLKEWRSSGTSAGLWISGRPGKSYRTMESALRKTVTAPG
jgi:hypothetical protein